jgi:membrane protein implicated in regulation of membrane protease activity
MWEMSIGVGIFLMVLGAILAFAVEATTPGINVHTLGIILLLTGLVAVLYSLLFWSNLSPWGRRSVARRRAVVEERPVRVVEERPVEVIEERPVEVIEERPFDDGLP